MGKKRNVISLGVAAVAAAALIAVGVVYESGDKSGSAASGSIAAKALGAEDLRAVLVPTDKHPEGTVVSEEAITVQRAVGEGLLEPSGMTFSPESCIRYFDEAIGGIGSLTGWIQYGTRPPDPTHHSDVYSHTVLAYPGGSVLDRIRAGVATCRTGSVTLESRVTGTITYTEIPVPALPGARVFGVRSAVTFPATTDHTTAHMITSHGFVPEESCSTDVIYIEYGETLIEIVEPGGDSGSYADLMARTLYDRAFAVAAPPVTAVVK